MACRLGGVKPLYEPVLECFNWTLRCNLIGIQTFSSKENALGNVVCEMASILSRLQCVNGHRHGKQARHEWIHLTHWDPVMHTCVSTLSIIGSDNGLSPGRRQSHYLNLCWHIVDTNLRNKFQWNLKRNSYIFIKKCVWKCHLRNGGLIVSASIY